MYKNLLRMGGVSLQEKETRVIDSNERVAQRISELAEKMRQPENAGFMGGSDAGEDGVFTAGLSAEMVEGLLTDPDDPESGGAARSNVIKADREGAAMIAQAREEADQILEDARNRAFAEADEIRMRMQADLEREREDVLARAQEDGYNEGLQRAEALLNEERTQLMAEYQEMLEILEPQFIDVITGIYEHIFHVELSSYREILVYLISSTMQKIEGSKTYLIHVSREDYPYVSMQKKQIAQNMMAPNCEMEIVEDITLSQNECMIETEGGIFDCGLGTQLSELNQKLRLLSYEKS